ncbi:MAG: Rnf-Nqr domain containing protein, partial [Propionivibrio sp.]
ATLVTLVDMSLNAWMHDLYRVLGLFIALIVVNCAVLGRAESFASRSTVLASALDGLCMGLGFTVALTAIGLIRELIGMGTLFNQASLLLGPRFAFLEMKVFPDYGGVLMMVLPPAGFLVLGLLLAAKRLVERRAAASARSGAAALAVENATGCH